MKRLSICWIIGCLLELVACRPEVPTQAEQGETDVFPDYREVTVPVNMAPPNFKLVDQQLQGIIRLKTMNGELIIAADHGVFNLPETDWKVIGGQRQYIAFLLFHTAGDRRPIPGIQAGFGTICQPSGCVLDISTIWRYLLVLFLFQDL